MPEFRRKKIHLPRTSYLGPQWYFLTACTERRTPRFQDAGLVAEVTSLLIAKAEGADVGVEAYCFMSKIDLRPDHLHLLISGKGETTDCLRFMSVFKQHSAHAFRARTGERLWQPRYYDHILRDSERWEAVGWYIWMNPVRKGLCTRPDDWPFSGSQTQDWKRLLKPPKELWPPPWKVPGIKPGATRPR